MNSALEIQFKKKNKKKKKNTVINLGLAKCHTAFFMYSLLDR